MAKVESTLFNMTLTLVVIALVTSASLGFMYQLTKEPIDAANMMKQDFAIKAVLPQYDNNPLADVYEIDHFDNAAGKLTCYPGSQNGNLSGIAVNTWTKNGYSARQ